MTTFQPKIDSEVLQSIDEIKPKYITTTAFINQLLEEGIEYKKLKKQNMFNYIYTLKNENINLEEQKEEQKEKINKKEKPEEKVIPEDLKPYTELIKNFWKVKKGSKSVQAWKQQITEYRKFIDKYNSRILIEQLETGILNGTWCSLTVKNYEQYYLKNNKFTPPEPVEKHPSGRVFKASEQSLPKTLAELKAEAVKRGVA
jgi:hypothetical protein